MKRFVVMLSAMSCLSCGLEEELAEEDDGTASEIEEQTQALDSCSPGPLKIAIFQNAQFGGSCNYVGIGKHPMAYGTSFLPNDSISSIKIGSGVYVRVCRDIDWGGSCLVGLADDLSSMPNGFNDAISSIEVYARSTSRYLDTPGTGEVAIFKDANYSGYSTVLGNGSYPNPGAMGLANDSMTSIKLGSNVQATLCRDVWLSGYCETVTSSRSSLLGYAIGNDTVTSMKVLAFKVLPPGKTP